MMKFSTLPASFGKQRQWALTHLAWAILLLQIVTSAGKSISNSAHFGNLLKVGSRDRQDPTRCETMPDKINCCYFNNPKDEYCKQIKSTCADSSADPICPECSLVDVGGGRLSRCCSLNPKHRECHCDTSSDKTLCCKFLKDPQNCNKIKTICSNSPTDTICPDCTTTGSLKYLCCDLNPKHKACSNHCQNCADECKSASDLVGCCATHPGSAHCHKIFTTCFISAEDPICPKCSTSDGAVKESCCQLSPRDEACVGECEFASDKVECCAANPESDHCLKIHNSCVVSIRDPICPKCATSSNKEFCCYLSPNDEACIYECEKAHDKVECCGDFPGSAYCGKIANACRDSAGDPICPKCEASANKKICCHLSPKDKACTDEVGPGPGPDECSTASDIAECCTAHPESLHCHNIFTTCYISPKDPICPKCSTSSVKELCCQLSPNDEACEAECELAHDKAECCADHPESAYCHKISSTCVTSPEDPICPKCETSNNREFCCKLSPNDNACINECESADDVPECCSSYPGSAHCSKIAEACRDSAEDPICPKCDATSHKEICCQLSPKDKHCLDYCRFASDTVECCDVDPNSSRCKEIFAMCAYWPIPDICPSCLDSSNKKFCCEISPHDDACIDECGTADDIAECCAEHPESKHCQVVAETCAFSSDNPICPCCSNTLNKHKCCHLSPKDEACSGDNNECETASDVVECCARNLESAHCQKIIRTCAHSPDDPICPCCLDTSNKPFCCQLSPKDEACIDECETVSDVVECCAAHPNSTICQKIIRKCANSPDDPICPNCSISSNKPFCCRLSPKDEACTTDVCESAPDVVECCAAHPDSTICQKIIEKCAHSADDPICPCCSISSNKLFCCQLSPKDEACIDECETASDVVKCCAAHPESVYCRKIIDTCAISADDIICPCCATSSDKDFCCQLSPKDEACIDDECESAPYVEECCVAYPESAHCQKIIRTCAISPHHPICPDCSKSIDPNLCCQFNPKHEACIDKDKCRLASDVVECCATHPVSAHCRLIFSKCAHSPHHPICPECGTSSNKDFCCQLSPKDEACIDKCESAPYVEECCVAYPESAHCQKIIKTCAISPHHPICPDCSKSIDPNLCCQFNPKHEACIDKDKCRLASDIVECCEAHLQSPHCQKIIRTCAISSEDPICPPCSTSSNKIFCCVLNPTDSACETEEIDCKSHPDVAACCKLSPDLAYCKNVSKTCVTNPTALICPKNCSISSEKYFCCMIKPADCGCPKDCAGEKDIVKCCEAYPMFSHCAKVRTVCATSYANPICPDCSKTSSVTTCCLLNPTHLSCPENCVPGR